ncbi:CPA2 [Branchiostoma lanceolatum]|uniref:CPA2 protein n=1 Tax=Branchiostoma lanceolatum TaxID=7740 RepID=A0A8K0EWB1_BRALA|nr:CPA2 [Branchiostoma lanceolatum]
MSTCGTNQIILTLADPWRVIERRCSTSHETCSPCRYLSKLLYPYTPGISTMKVLLLLFTITLASGVTRFDGEQVLRVIPQDELQLQELAKLEMTDFRLDFWKSASGLFRPVDVRVPKNLLTYVKKLLDSTGMNHTVMIDDLQQLINNQTSTSITNEFDFDKYNSYEEINAQLKEFADKYQSLTTLIKIGASHESRDIYAIRVGNSGTDKPAIFLEGQIHSREWIVSATLLYNIKFLLEGYGTEDRITKLMDEVDFYFLPVTNVDGYVYTWTTNRLWRKTRSGPIDGCYGVDPNRNWDDHFGDPGASDNPCSDTYHGPSAFSEVETKSLSNWVLENGKNIKAYLAVHSYSEMWMSPYGWTSDLPPDYEDQD